MDRKKIIAVFLLILFGCMQLIDLHTLEHDDEHEHEDCELCQAFSIDHTDDYIFFPSYAFEEVHIPLEISLLTFYNSPTTKGRNFLGFFNKPPPTLFS